MITVARQRRLRARREPRHRRDARADRRGAERRSHDGGRYGEGDARPLRRRAGARRVRSAHPQPRRLRLPVGAAFAVGPARGRARAARPVVADEPVHRRAYRQLDADPSRPRSVDWVSGAAVWLRRSALDASAAGTSATSCTWRTSTSAGGCGAPASTSRTSPAGAVTHVQGASTSRTPYRMLVEHHRSAWRFARRRLTGAARAFCCRSRRCICGVAVRPGDGRARLACVQARPRPAASLPVVTNASRAKRKRAAVRSAKRSRQNSWWYGLTAIVVIAGHRARSSTPRPPRPPPVGPFLQNSSEPTKKDTHWHAALGVYDCDHWMGDSTGTGIWNWPHATPVGAARPAPTNTNVYAGLHSHDDGVIHMEPLGLRRGRQERDRRPLLRVRRLEALVDRLHASSARP